MKQSIDTSNAFSSSSEMKHTGFSIKEADMPFVLSALSNLYSDTITAILREYATNGYDAHKEAGTPNRPIDIYFPSAFDNDIRFRDYGVGMSEDTVVDIFSGYGASTKRDSNLYNGQLGLGSKCALGYTDSFNVITYVDKIKTIYNVSKNNSGITKVFSEVTDEPNGTEISVTVEDRYDKSRFQEKARDVYKYFGVKPNLHGYTNLSPIERDKAKFETLNFRVTGGQSVIVMGDVAYPINYSSIGVDDDQIRSIIDAGVEIDVPIGAVDFTPSREDLRYDRECTKETVITSLNLIKDNIISMIQEEVEKQLTYLGAVSKLYDLQSTFGRIEGVKKNSYLYKGNILSIPIDPYVEINNYKIIGYGEDVKVKRERAPFRTIHPNFFSDGRTLFFRNEGLSLPIITKKLRGYCQSIDKSSGFDSIIVFNFFDTYLPEDGREDPVKKLKESPFYKDLKVVLVDGLPNPKPIKRIGTTKASSNMFLFDNTCCSTKEKNYWKPVDASIDKDLKVYTGIDRYRALDTGSWPVRPQRVKDIIDLMSAVGLSMPPFIYGVKKAHLSKVKGKDDWINIYDYVKDQLDKNIDKALCSKLASCKSLSFDRTSYGTPFDVLIKRKDLLSDKESSLYKFLITLEDFDNNRTHDNYSLLSKLSAFSRIGINYEVKENVVINLNEMFLRVLEEFPLVDLISRENNYWELSDACANELIGYVNSK